MRKINNSKSFYWTHILVIRFILFEKLVHFYVVLRSLLKFKVCPHCFVINTSIYLTGANIAAAQISSSSTLYPLPILSILPFQP